MAKRYNFMTHEELQGRFVRCPKCHELLAPADLECFSSCPYCNVLLPRTQELEDFVADPLVQSWMSRYHMSRSTDGRSPR